MLDRIRARIAALSPAERRVAEYALAQPNHFAEAPIARIADAARVSQPTVVRFCRSLDCVGLTDFKLRLAKSLVAGVPYVHSTVVANDSTHDIAAKVFDNALAGLIRVRNDLAPAAIERAVELLATARRIEFYGMGNSGITATDAQHKFFRLGVPCVAYGDAHVVGMAAALLGEGDVVVAISNSGRTLDLLEAADVARSGGARVVGITRAESPLARRSHVVLAADTPEDPDMFSPMTSRLAHLALIDVLAVGVALRGGKPLADKLERAKRTLRSRRAQAGAAT